jgi:hypothetical protein
MVFPVASGRVTGRYAYEIFILLSFLRITFNKAEEPC